MKYLGDILILRFVLVAMFVTSFGVPGACALCCDEREAMVEVTSVETHSCCATATESGTASTEHEGDSCCSVEVGAIATPTTTHHSEECAACALCSSSDDERSPVVPTSFYQASTVFADVGPPISADIFLPHVSYAGQAHELWISPPLTILHCVYLR